METVPPAAAQPLFADSWPALFPPDAGPDPDLLLPAAPARTGRRGAPGPVTLAALAGAATLAAGYTVQPGDTLSELAERRGVSVSRIAEANGITDLDRIYVGQQLRMPDAGSSRSGDGASGSAGYHVVQPGETLGAIAAEHGLTVDGLAAANGITDPGMIMAGSRLRLGEAPAVPAPTTGGGSHVVEPGETLSGIAARHGVSVAELAAANDLPDPDVVRAGTRLRLPGGWRCPVPGARFVNDFGVPKTGGRFHEGIDLKAPRGTPVLAPVAGTVEQTTGSRGGRQFVLRGTDGVVYVGTHMASFGAGPGRVAAGDRLGRVGTSGNARGTTPHLHFEMERDGTDVNPYPLLVQACR